ncbi:methylthioribulose 1-phosphate dehydratase [Metabacillus halosaccharovorans]|uniref:methylthioribulose 1-phosphate dehydratase n=1 Tax=Metabacillus halosaccharovorans TaxID=930124 RepID=UPI00203E1EE1|nr:methylthioribulose 1-phosphate dehydratase [Metabacillus halosaccharovorans]MCM3441693.1 methylthioribulose 1-phosphate dehydratase [Metabacillus halosaccharovorans]
MSLLEQRWEELADIKRVLAKREWFPGTSGNLAIKVNSDPISFLVTASGKDKTKETSEDFLLVDSTGQPVHDTHLKPSAETLLHVEIFNKTNAGCSLHVHTVDNNVISELYGDQGKITFKGQEIIKAYGLWEEDAEFTIPIINNHAHIPTLAKDFSKFVKGDAGAVLIRNHGITVWGRDALEAKKFLEASEFLFSYHLKLMALKAVR